MPGYTALCLVALALTVALERILRTGLLRDRRFWIAMAIVAVFQVLVDGWLTCRPIVRYAEAHFSGVRFGCSPGDFLPRRGRAAGMPVEDLVFGFTMVTQTLLWWVWWGRRRSGGAEAA
jgi:lycopene cyclase domain-containing protein